MEEGEDVLGGGGREGVQEPLHVRGPQHTLHALRVRAVHVVVAAHPVPGGALHVEGREDAVAAVAVPDLEGRVAVGGDVGEERVARGPARERRAQHSAVGEHQPPQQLEVVLAGRVAHVHGAAAHRARRSMQPSRGVLALEHVPVGLRDLADEERVVRHVHDVRRVRGRRLRPEVVACAHHARALDRVQALARVAHAVDHLRARPKVLAHRLLRRLEVLGGHFPRPAALLSEHGGHGLDVDLDAVDAGVGQGAVDGVVELRRLGGEAEAPEHQRVPRHLRLHAQDALHRLRHLDARATGPRASLSLHPAPIPQQ
mmetsp:Transcript_37266/g.87981  ORF Transcript_37266/g.87981 Transcript_37266/m.87981 type:complete len:314 (+) Transcript_37266:532-1473(+)